MLAIKRHSDKTDMAIRVWSAASLISCFIVFIFYVFTLPDHPVCNAKMVSILIPCNTQTRYFSHFFILNISGFRIMYICIPAPVSSIEFSIIFENWIGWPVLRNHHRHIWTHPARPPPPDPRQPPPDRPPPIYIRRSSQLYTHLQSNFYR